MSLVTIQRSPTPPVSTDTSSLSLNDESIGNNSQSEDFFASKATAVLQNQYGRRRSSVIKEGDTIQVGLKKAYGLLRKEDSLKLIVNLEKVNSRMEGYRYICVVVTNGKQDTEEFLVLGVDICSNKATIGLVLPVCQDMSVALDGDGGFKVKNKDGEKLFKPTSVHALWSTVQLLNKACSISRDHNYYIGGLSHTWIGVYISQISSNRAQIAEWNRMIDADTITNSSLAPKSSVGEFVLGTTVDERVQNKDEIRKHLKEIMRDEDMDNVTVTFLREKLQENVSFCLKEYRKFIAEEILIIYGKMDSASQILPHLYLGSTYNASNLEELMTNKITHILNVTRECENFFREEFIYKNVEVFDVDETNLLNFFNDCYQFIRAAKNQNTACLVHCQRGISRSATVVIAYMMKEYNLSRDEAIERVKSKRDCIHPNDGFLLQMKTYEGILKARHDFNSLVSSRDQERLKQFGNEKRCKIMSFPNELYQTQYRDATMESPSFSCPFQTTDQRQSASNSYYDREISCFTELSSLNASSVDPPTLIDHNSFDVEEDDSVRLPERIDIHEDLLMYKSDTAGRDPNDCLFDDALVDRSTDEFEIVKNAYHKESTSLYIPDVITSTNFDDVGDCSLKTQGNDFSKRSLRLKGDASWIKPSAAPKDTSVMVSSDEAVCRSSTMAESDDNRVQCLSTDPESDSMVVTDIDHQSLRSVKELRTKYLNNNNNNNNNNNRDN